MRDPHVQVMHYQVSSEEWVVYQNPKPISFSNDLGAFEVSAKRLRVTPAKHFPNEMEARRAVDPFLKDWEIEADLKINIGMLRFKFESVEMIDRDPPPTGSPVTINSKVASVVVEGRCSIGFIPSEYPQPPKKFRATRAVQSVYDRWIGFRSGKEPLQSMAYFVLTSLQTAAGGGKSTRKMAARAFQIDLPVLNKIGELSSDKGDGNAARKARPNNKSQELSQIERDWLEVAIRRVIYRLGEHDPSVQLAPISLADLPKL